MRVVAVSGTASAAVNETCDTAPMAHHAILPVMHPAGRAASSMALTSLIASTASAATVAEVSVGLPALRTVDRATDRLHTHPTPLGRAASVTTPVAALTAVEVIPIFIP